MCRGRDNHQKEGKKQLVLQLPEGGQEQKSWLFFERRQVETSAQLLREKNKKFSFSEDVHAPEAAVAERGGLGDCINPHGLKVARASGVNFKNILFEFEIVFFLF